MKIVIAVIIFSAIILFHELGHFLLAKKNHVVVKEFSLGMGPRLWRDQVFTEAAADRRFVYDAGRR